MPDVFYPMDRDDFWLLFNGWNDLKIYEQTIARKQTELIAAAFVGSQKAQFVRHSWPIGKETGKPGGVTDKQRELLAKFKVMEAANGNKRTTRSKRRTGGKRDKPAK